VATGASFGVQITVAITLVIAMLTVEEIILVSHPARPAKTQAFLRRLHDWALANRRKLVVAIFGVVGGSLIAQGNVACVLCFRMSAHFILLLSTPIASQVAAALTSGSLGYHLCRYLWSIVVLWSGIA